MPTRATLTIHRSRLAMNTAVATTITSGRMLRFDSPTISGTVDAASLICKPRRVSEIRGRPCSIAAALQVVGDRWSLLVVREVLFGNHRFGEIVRNTGAPRDQVLQPRGQAVAGCAGVSHDLPEPVI